jgi:peroxiredoxin
MNGRGSTVAILMGFALIGLAAGLAVFRAPVEAPLAADTGPAATPTGPRVGSPAPDFLLTSLAGVPVRLSGLEGRAVLVNFWATWCDPCRLEMPDLQARAERFPDRLVILGVNFDEPESDVRAFAEELRLTFPLLLDPGAEVQEAYRVLGYPTSVFVDETGIIRAVHVGIMSSDQIDGYLANLGLTA